MVIARNGALTAGLAVATVAAIAALVGGCQPASRLPTVTVALVGPDAPAGLIGHGTIAGKPWRFRLIPSKSLGVGCGQTARFAQDCTSGITSVWDEKWPVKSEPLYLQAEGQTFYGQVQPVVTWVSARLSDGAVLGLRPVGAYGRRWIALALPDQLSVSELTAYSARGEIAHSVPFLYGPLNGPEFLSWLPPGDSGPARRTWLLDPSIMPGQRLYVGPWGNCLMRSPGSEMCWPVGAPTFEVVEDIPGYPMTPRIAVITYRPGVAYLVLTMSNGTTERVPVVRGAGMVFAAFKVARHPAIVSWGAYDSAGRRVSGGNGPPDSSVCPPSSSLGYCGSVG